MRIGIDDTDSAAGMCTTYLGAVLVRRLEERQLRVRKASLIRLNPNVKFKTRGNAAICIEADGDPKVAFATACACVEELAEFDAEQTEPGVVVTERLPGIAFYERAVRDFCTIPEAIDALETCGALYKGYKGGRGLIGATAAVACELADATFEHLAYRDPAVRTAKRSVDRDSLFLADERTFPRTWDTVDRENGVVVCVPHTPDPVLFGIRGASPADVAVARSFVRSETPAVEQTYVTNQGTDAHLVPGRIGALGDGRSYWIEATVTGLPVTAKGGHVAVLMADGGDHGGGRLRCMAYEPTKGFRRIVRALLPGDRVIVAGSYKGESLNLEKICILSCAPQVRQRPPVCPACGKRMTGAGRDKGYKCRSCGARERIAESSAVPRGIRPGWYEVPSCARRHLAKPLCRGEPDLFGTDDAYP